MPCGQFLCLPSEGIRLVHNLHDVAPSEGDASIGAGEGRVLLRSWPVMAHTYS